MVQLRIVYKPEPTWRSRLMNTQRYVANTLWDKLDSLPTFGVMAAGTDVIRFPVNSRFPCEKEPEETERLASQYCKQWFRSSGITTLRQQKLEKYQPSKVGSFSFTGQRDLHCMESALADDQMGSFVCSVRTRTQASCGSLEAKLC